VADCLHHRLGVGDACYGATQASAGNRLWWRAHPQRSLSLEDRRALQNAHPASCSRRFVRTASRVPSDLLTSREHRRT
jgi:hypothetical protein